MFGNVVTKNYIYIYIIMIIMQSYYSIMIIDSISQPTISTQFPMLLPIIVWLWVDILNHILQELPSGYLTVC